MVRVDNAGRWVIARNRSFVIDMGTYIKLKKKIAIRSLAVNFRLKASPCISRIFCVNVKFLGMFIDSLFGKILRSLDFGYLFKVEIRPLSTYQLIRNFSVLSNTSDTSLKVDVKSRGFSMRSRKLPKEERFLCKGRRSYSANMKN